MCGKGVFSHFPTTIFLLAFFLFFNIKILLYCICSVLDCVNVQVDEDMESFFSKPTSSGPPVTTPGKTEESPKSSRLIFLYFSLYPSYAPAEGVHIVTTLSVPPKLFLQNPWTKFDETSYVMSLEYVPMFSFHFSNFRLCHWKREFLSKFQFLLLSPSVFSSPEHNMLQGSF